MMQINFYTDILHLATRVVEVKATDADDPTTPNGQLRYSFVTKVGEQSKFSIDSITGKMAALTSNKIVPCIVFFFPNPERYIDVQFICADLKDNTSSIFLSLLLSACRYDHLQYR